MDRSFRQWASPLVGMHGKYLTYNDMPTELKMAYKDAHVVFNEDPDRFIDIMDYFDYVAHPVKYKIKHMFKKGGNK